MVLEAGMEIPLPVCEQQEDYRGHRRLEFCCVCLQLSTSNKWNPL